MDKREQLIKELQALLDKPEMNEIIQEKLSNTYYEGRRDESSLWVERLNKISERLKEHMPQEEQKRMDKTHFFYAGDDDDPECSFCGISQREMFDWPQYCLTKEEKAK